MPRHRCVSGYAAWITSTARLDGGRRGNGGVVSCDRLKADGPVLRPGDPDYDLERAGYNQIVQHHPAVIVGATGVRDVVAAVNCASEEGLPVAVQATGHGVSIPADGAVFMNTRRMDGVQIDPVDRTARVGAGVRARELVQGAAAHGLAPLNGSAPEVGVVSYILGGGIAMLGRRYGYAADHVREIDVVTADGHLRTASDVEEPDLFWALRGGKGNFGVVTSMEIDLVPVERLYGGGLWFGAASCGDALHAYSDWIRDVPDEMGSSVLLIQLPDVPFIPEQIRGRYVAHVRIAYMGPTDQGEQVVKPLRDVAPTLLDTVQDMAYGDVGSIHNEPTESVPFYGRNSMLSALDHDAVDALLRVAGPHAEAPYLVELRHLGGALSRPARVPNALGRRDAQLCLYTGSIVAPETTDTVRAAQNELHEALSPWGTGGVCLNFLTGPEVTLDVLRSGYLPEDFARLTELKGRYDPHNLFRINHNIPPAASV